MSKPEHSPLPCPFCGGEASGNGSTRYSENMVRENGWDQDTFYFCNCVKCGASNLGIVGHRTREQAIAHWNTRPTDNKAAIAELVDCLGDMLEGDDGQAWKEARRVYEKHKAVKS